MRINRRRSSLLCLCVLVGACCGTTLANGVGELTMLKSTSGRFVIVGSDRIENQLVAKWAESMLGKVERVLALKMPFRGRTFRIVLKKSSQAPEVVVTESLGAEGLLQRLVVSNVQDITHDEMLEPFCSLLLNGYVSAIQENRVPSGPEPRGPGQAQGWLSRGMAQNLDAEHKAQYAELILSKWEKGQAPTLTKLLSAERLMIGETGKQDIDLPLDRAACGLLVGWLMSERDREEIFKKLLEQAARGKQAGVAELVASLPQCKDLGDLTEAWDKWILRQDRIVYLPGTVSLRNIRQLKGLLLLYPGDFGIPISSSPGKPLTLATLIEEKRSAWAGGAARNLSGRLQLMGVGRPEEYKAVIALYVRFLDGVIQQKRAGSLERMLRDANRALDQLAAKLNEKPVGQGKESKD